jgi:hypothetical protein
MSDPVRFFPLRASLSANTFTHCRGPIPQPPTLPIPPGRSVGDLHRALGIARAALEVANAKIRCLRLHLAALNDLEASRLLWLDF